MGSVSQVGRAVSDFESFLPTTSLIRMSSSCDLRATCWGQGTPVAGIWTGLQDIVSWLLKSYVEKDTSAAPTEAALDEDSRVVVVVSSEITATTLAYALYYLVKNPAILSRLQRHLDEDMLKETLRLRAVVMTGGYRITPAEGIQIGEIYIPRGVNVFVPVQLVLTDERYYNDSKRFVPE